MQPDPCTRSDVAVLGLCFAALSLTGCGAAQAPQPTTDGAREAYAVTPDGVRLYYRTIGAGPRTVIAPFALYHESALDLLAVDHRVVTYDPRGRGRSGEVPPASLSLDRLVDDINTIAGAVGAETFALIGWSGGGMESFVYALRNPGRVTRLVQLAPVAARFTPYGSQMMEDRDRRTDPVARAEYRRRREANELGDTAAQCRAEQQVSDPAMFASPGNRPATPDVCRHRNEHPDRIGPYFGRLFESIDGYDWRPSLGRVTIPRLVIHGRADNTPLAGNEEWVAGQPHARLLIIEGAGHWPHYEQPRATLAAIAEFLNGAWPAAAATIP
jgi:pimeloyl-ACP methyl ester carboxylesterase